MKMTVAAACGDKETLKKLAEASKQPGNNSAFAKKYLATVIWQGTGDKMSQIDEAVYDPATVTWTIPATN